MDSLIIQKTSVLNSLLSSDGWTVKSEFIPVLSGLKSKARAAVVSFYFYDSKVQIIGRYSRTVSVPKKCQNDFKTLCKWIEERIKKAW